VAQIRRLIRAGWSHLLDADIEKFFDRVEHSKLLETVRRAIPGKSASWCRRGL
jgi:retron-type reverse transcriptase